MTCTNCGTENKPGRKFCASCGVALGVVPDVRRRERSDGPFCGECGRPLAPGAPADERAAPVAERRLVSILFMDLVGFTAASESRDAEDVRDLLSRYFDVARTVVGRYGGTIEKFIGDAVMAVWGTPISPRGRRGARGRERRSSWSRRSPSSGRKPAWTASPPRAGVATGETAVTLDAEGQGMVAGDHREHRVPRPVGRPARRRLRDRSDTACRPTPRSRTKSAGPHELKGKSEPLTPIARCASSRSEEQASSGRRGLESPFVGRERELRLVKELFHASADQRADAPDGRDAASPGSASPVSRWEFFKYIDGLADDATGIAAAASPTARASRTGRSPRWCEVAPGSPRKRSRHRLPRSCPRWSRDSSAMMEERRWIEGRLAQLHRPRGSGTASRDDLRSLRGDGSSNAIAQRGPVVLVFEDLQWAGSRAPRLHRASGWIGAATSPSRRCRSGASRDRRSPDRLGNGRRGVTSLFLEPLDDATMEALLRGMVPGLPGAVGREIRERSEGIPLYAVETVRMLLDRGLLRRDGDRVRTDGSDRGTSTPETLHTLIQARFDGLAPEDRALLQDASVLGKTFRRTRSPR